MSKGLAHKADETGTTQSQSCSGQSQGGAAHPGVDYRKRISNHVAFGLLVYSGLHIFVTIGMLKTSHGSVLPYFSLVVLVAAIIPACRWFEKKWEKLGDAAASDPAMAPLFRRDVLLIWLGAIGLPVVLTGLFKGVVALL